MAIRQTRVFVRSDEPHEDWAETLIGRVFCPLTNEFTDTLVWFWFSRYGAPATDSGDCNIAVIPDEYKQPLQPGGERVHRSMRFRFNIADDRQAEFERRASELIEQGRYAISDFSDYSYIGDIGNNRFLGVENRQPGRAEQRAVLATNFYWVISRLVIDTLVGPDEHGRFRIETNDDLMQNPRGSTFQSLLHLFCNITNAPTDVYIFHKTSMKLIGYGTYIYPPPEPPGGWDSVTPYPIRY